MNVYVLCCEFEKRACTLYNNNNYSSNVVIIMFCRM